MNNEIKAGKRTAKEVKEFLKASYNKKPPEKINNWVLDKDLSKDTAKVYYNPTTGEAVVSHRGTKGIKDWGNNLAYTLGAYEYTSRYKKGKAIQDKAEKKYGKKNISTLGHSQGSIIARKTGKDTKEIINVNPANKGEIPSKNEYNVRSSGDIISSLHYPISKLTDRSITIPSKNIFDVKGEHSYNILDRLPTNTEIGRNNISNNNIMKAGRRTQKLGYCGEDINWINGGSRRDEEGFRRREFFHPTIPEPKNSRELTDFEKDHIKMSELEVELAEEDDEYKKEVMLRKMRGLSKMFQNPQMYYDDNGNYLAESDTESELGIGENESEDEGKSESESESESELQKFQKSIGKIKGKKGGFNPRSIKHQKTMERNRDNTERINAFNVLATQYNNLIARTQNPLFLEYISSGALNEQHLQQNLARLQGFLNDIPRMNADDIVELMNTEAIPLVMETDNIFNTGAENYNLFLEDRMDDRENEEYKENENDNVNNNTLMRFAEENIQSAVDRYLSLINSPLYSHYYTFGKLNDERIEQNLEFLRDILDRIPNLNSEEISNILNREVLPTILETDELIENAEIDYENYIINAQNENPPNNLNDTDDEEDTESENDNEEGAGRKSRTKGRKRGGKKLNIGKAFTKAFNPVGKAFDTAGKAMNTATDAINPMSYMLKNKKTAKAMGATGQATHDYILPAVVEAGKPIFDATAATASTMLTGNPVLGKAIASTMWNQMVEKPGYDPRQNQKSKELGELSGTFGKALAKPYSRGLIGRGKRKYKKRT